MKSHDPQQLLAVFAGGALGGMARAGLVELVPTEAGQWPWATFTANLLGTALLAHVVTRLQERLPLSAYRRPLIGTGLCGALTTFSTMQLELVQMLDAGRVALAGAYAAASVGAALLVVALATSLTRRTQLLR